MAWHLTCLKAALCLLKHEITYALLLNYHSTYSVLPTLVATKCVFNKNNTKISYFLLRYFMSNRNYTIKHVKNVKNSRFSLKNQGF